MAHDARDQLLDSLIEGAPLGIAIVDRRWRVTRVNRLAAEILQRRPEELVGQDVWSATKWKGSPYEAACRKAKLQGTIERFVEKGGAGGITYQVQVAPGADGLVLWWLEAGEPGSATEKALRLRVLAHDLRTPLTVISLNAELLAAMAAARGDVAGQQKAEASSKAAQQLTEIAQQLSATLREGTK